MNIILIFQHIGTISCGKCIWISSTLCVLHWTLIGKCNAAQRCYPFCIFYSPWYILCVTSILNNVYTNSIRPAEADQNPKNTHPKLYRNIGARECACIFSKYLCRRNWKFWNFVLWMPLTGCGKGCVNLRIYKLAKMCNVRWRFLVVWRNKKMVFYRLRFPFPLVQSEPVTPTQWGFRLSCRCMCEWLWYDLSTVPYHCDRMWLHFMVHQLHWHNRAPRHESRNGWESLRTNHSPLLVSPLFFISFYFILCETIIGCSSQKSECSAIPALWPM